MDLLSCDHFKYISTFLSLSAKLCLRHTSTKFICIKIENKLDLHIDIFDDAIEHDNPILLIYLEKCGYKLTLRTFFRSIGSNSFNIVKWCIKESHFKDDVEKYKGRTDSSLTPVSIAAGANSLSILKLLIEEKYYIDSLSLFNAVKNQNEEMINILLEFCTITYQTFTEAVRNFKILKLLYSHLDHEYDDIFGVNSWILNAASRIGNIDIVKWMMEKGATLTEQSTIYATEGGNLELLEFLIENDAPYNYCTIFCTAMRYGRLHILDWVLKCDGRIPCHIILYVTNGEADFIPKIEWLLTNSYTLTEFDLKELKRLNDKDVNLFLRSTHY